jgi:hypothetical protein
VHIGLPDDALSRTDDDEHRKYAQRMRHFMRVEDREYVNRDQQTRLSPPMYPQPSDFGRPP